MSNVVRLFAPEKIENPAGPTTIAAAYLLAAFAELDRAIRQFSKHLDLIDDFIDPTGDPEVRKRQEQLREASAIAVRNLSQAIRQLPILQISAILETARVPGP